MGLRRGLLVASAALAGGCSAGIEADITAEFSAENGEGRIDQVVWLENVGPKTIAPRLEFTPRDRRGEEVDGLKVRTAYGSDRGRRLLPPGSEVLEILSFEGARKRDVEDVDVHFRFPEEVDLPAGVEDPEVVEIGANGKPIRLFGLPFETFRIPNENDVEVAVRVVFIEYEDPRAGEAQQFTRITPLTGLVRIPAGETSVHTFPEELRDRVGSVKAYLSR